LQPLAPRRPGDAVVAMIEPVSVAVEFNEAINAQRLDRLDRLMSDDHRFVDTVGSVTRGKDACVAAWRGFFDSFPEYRNVFDAATAHDDLVVVRGRSECSEPTLDGPALWAVRIAGGKVSEWRVYDDNAANRGALNL
jgi:ketosteroid isomerase-like protein